MSERYEYGKWMESGEIGHNKRVARYNAKHNRITFEHYSQTLEEFEQTVAKLYPVNTVHRIELDDFIQLCKQSTQVLQKFDENKFRSEFLGEFPPPHRCAVKIVSTGEHCPEEGVFDIGDGEFICKKCARNISESPLPKLMDDLVPLPRVRNPIIEPSPIPRVRNPIIEPRIYTC